MKYEKGQKVGVFLNMHGVLFGTVDFVYPYGHIRVKDNWNGDFCEFPAQYVFPAWQGIPFTEADFMRLGFYLRRIGFDGLGNAVEVGFADYPGRFILGVCNDIKYFLEEGKFKQDPVEEMAVKRFLDWAAHGFPAAGGLQNV